MGTRSLTHIKNQSGQTLVTLYRQYDGYPDGHGQELADFLKGKTIVNGFSGEDKTRGNFNGMECLAASVIAFFKEGIGGFYLQPPDSKDFGEDYTYTIYQADNRPAIKIECGMIGAGEVIFDGLADNFSKETCEEA